MILPDLLKERTRLHHARLEKMIIARLKDVKTKEDYSAIIRYFYSYYHPLEQALAKFDTRSVLPDIDDRRKSASLYSDLKVLGGAPGTAMATIRPVNSLSEAMGSLYVLEGSTLGGLIIAGMLAKALPGLEGCFSFFTAYGENTQGMWATFRSQLVVCSSVLDKEEVIAGAVNTFDGLADWFTENMN